MAKNNDISFFFGSATPKPRRKPSVKFDLSSICPPKAEISLSEVLDAYQIYGDGDTYRCINHDHADDNPSTTIFHDDDGDRVHCWSCNTTYDVYDVVSILEDIPLTRFYQIRRKLAKMDLTPVEGRASAKPKVTLPFPTKEYDKLASLRPKYDEEFLTCLQDDPPMDVYSRWEGLFVFAKARHLDPRALYDFGVLPFKVMVQDFEREEWRALNLSEYWRDKHGDGVLVPKGNPAESHRTFQFRPQVPYEGRKSLHTTNPQDWQRWPICGPTIDSPVLVITEGEPDTLQVQEWRPDVQVIGLCGRNIPESWNAIFDSFDAITIAIHWEKGKRPDKLIEKLAEGGRYVSVQKVLGSHDWNDIGDEDHPHKLGLMHSIDLCFQHSDEVRQAREAHEDYLKFIAKNK